MKLRITLGLIVAETTFTMGAVDGVNGLATFDRFGGLAAEVDVTILAVIFISFADDVVTVGDGRETSILFAETFGIAGDVIADCDVSIGAAFRPAFMSGGSVFRLIVGFTAKRPVDDDGADGCGFECTILGVDWDITTVD